MNKKTIQMDSMTYDFLIHEDIWKLNMPKSQTRVKDVRQLALINQDTELFVPSKVEESDDVFTFSFMVDPRTKKWGDLLNLSRSDKLRLLCNVARFRKFSTTRTTFFLHPDNLIVDDNLMPTLVYHGIRELVPPYEMNEDTLTLQYKCLIIALFSKKYSFDELYLGSWKNAKDTLFERQVVEAEDLDSIIKLLEDNYLKEKKETEKNMQIVPKKRFRLFKQLTFILIALSIILAVPLIYLSFVKTPFQEHLLEAHRHFLSLDYENVIYDLEGQNPEKLPDPSKYILAYSFIKSEKLSEDQKDAILKNISVKSDPNYLLYWIYNGRGDFDKTVDLAKYIDDPQLIMYGLIQQIERAKNDPELSGTEREKKVQKYEAQYKTYLEKYGLDSLLDQQSSQSSDLKENNQETNDQEATNTEINNETVETVDQSTEDKK